MNPQLYGLTPEEIAIVEGTAQGSCPTPNTPSSRSGR